MRGRIFSVLLALALMLGAASTASAAESPTLRCDVYLSGGEVELYLTGLDGSEVYGAQVELTLEGDYSLCTFTPVSRTAYAPDCLAEARGGRTNVTVYLTDSSPLNEGQILNLGTLSVGNAAGLALPDKARITLLDKDLRPMTGRMAGTVPVDGTVLKEDGPASTPPSDASTSVPQLPNTPQLPGEATVLPFADVRGGDWFYDAVGYVYGKGMMQGVSASAFGPYGSTSRAMIVTILHRLEGSPAALPAAFRDVAQNAYYAAPVAWASANGIVTGYDDGTFRPETPITREQLASILYRYAAYKGLLSPSTPMANPNRFPDGSSVSPYAVQAVSWALAAGLLTGSDGMLLPQGTASRAQAAVILQRFCGGLMGLT